MIPPTSFRNLESERSESSTLLEPAVLYGVHSLSLTAFSVTRSLPGTDPAILPRQLRTEGSMTTRSERLNRLTIATPCQESWQAMNGGEQTRFCLQCHKHVYDLATLEAREVEALIEATQGRLCARITRDRFGRMVTREPDPLPFQRLSTVSVRRTSPVVAAVVTAVVGLTGAGWAQEPVSPPVAAAPAAPDLAHPSGPGGAVLEGQAVDVQGLPLPGVTIVLRHLAKGWRLVAVTDDQGGFQLRDLPSGTYDVDAELEGFEFGTLDGLVLGPEGGQISLTGVLLEDDGVAIVGVLVMDPLPLDAAFQQSHVVVTATVGRSVTLEEPDAESVVRKVRTELRVTSVFKGKPHSKTLQIEHYVVPDQPETFRPGDVVLALLTPLEPGDGRPDPLVYVSTDPLQVLHPLPADPRLRELGIDEAGWRALSYIARGMDDNALQELVTLALKEVEKERRQLGSGEKRLRARTSALEADLRFRFMQVLGGGD